MIRPTALLAWLVLVAPSHAGTSLLIEAAELQPLLGKLRVVDLRPAEEFAKGHIPGAVNCSLRALDQPEANRKGLPVPLEQARALFRDLGISQRTRVVAYDDQGGRFAARFFYVAEFFGHRRVRVLNGGWPAWLQAGGSQETETRPMPPGNFEPRPNPRCIATAEWIQARLAGNKLQLLDVRSAEEYSGTSAPAGGRGGHIPGAIHLDWRQTTTESGRGRFKAPQELRRLLLERGVDLRRETVTYCASGIRSAQLYFVLRLLGQGKVRNYDGSWADWGSRADLPVQR